MSRVVFLLLTALTATTTFGHDEFYGKYTYAKTMSQCFGSSAYQEYLLRITQAKRECRGLFSSTTRRPYDPYPTQRPYDPYTTQRPYNDPYTTQRPYDPYTTQRPYYGPYTTTTMRYPSYSGDRYSTSRPFYTVTSPPLTVGLPNRDRNRPRYPSYGAQPQYFPGLDRTKIDFFNDFSNSKSQHHENKLYDSHAITSAITEISDALRNFTCVLSKLQLIDQYLRVNYDMIVNNYFQSPIDDNLRTDLLSGINYCKQLTACLPEDKSPISHELQLVMAFIKCEKKTRLAACFKHDLRRNIHRFETSALPDDGGKTTDLEKLMTILIGTNSLDQLEMY